MRAFFLRSSMLFVISVFSVSCAQDVAYRRAPASVEIGKYTTKDVGGQNEAPITGDYILGYVEFDDQGWFHDLSQRTALFDQVLKSRSEDKDRQFLIVAYAHGWKHNASEGDPDVENFKKLLERLDTLEQKLAQTGVKKARKVVGVYLGWRGASLSLPYINNVTFWTRKNTGERVGDGSAKQLLLELNEFRTCLNGWERKDRDKLARRNDTQLILIGHSFGGMLMYHALHTELIERTLHIKESQDGYSRDIAKSFGDFILLVNPAFEGSAYEPLFQAAMTHKVYSDKQRPAMAIITSETDWATKYAFFAGRLYTGLQSAPREGERTTVFNTVGHLSRYITHRLTYQPPAQTTITKKENLSDTTIEQADKTISDLSQESKESEESDGKSYGGVTINSTRQDLNAKFPYLVMSAEKTIINGHNDIWNDVFAQFMESFITSKVMKTDQNNEKMEANQELKRRECTSFWQEAASQ